jgi:hypothetical protein
MWTSLGVNTYWTRKNGRFRLGFGAATVENLFTRLNRRIDPCQSTQSDFSVVVQAIALPHTGRPT